MSVDVQILPSLDSGNLIGLFSVTSDESGIICFLAP